MSNRCLRVKLHINTVRSVLILSDFYSYYGYWAATIFKKELLSTTKDDGIDQAGDLGHLNYGL